MLRLEGKLEDSKKCVRGILAVRINYDRKTKNIFVKQSGFDNTALLECLWTIHNICSFLYVVLELIGKIG